MKQATKIAAFGLAAGAAVMFATAVPAVAWGPQGGFGPDAGLGTGEPGGVLAVAFADLDADGNGTVTQADLDAWAAAKFAAVDTDASGTLSAAELAAQAAARIEARLDGQTPGLRRGDPATIAATFAGRIVAARDTDGDGLLSASEVAPNLDFARLINRFDTDDDNAWSDAEFTAAQTELQARFADRGGSRGDRGRPQGGPAQGKWR